MLHHACAMGIPAAASQGVARNRRQSEPRQEQQDGDAAEPERRKSSPDQESERILVK
jgi:hypothetical protein